MHHIFSVLSTFNSFVYLFVLSVNTRPGCGKLHGAWTLLSASEEEWLCSGRGFTAGCSLWNRVGLSALLSWEDCWEPDLFSEPL